MQPGAGANVDQVVGLPHHGFVMLDDQHRVALHLQFAQGVDQPLIVARVQADRWLVQHIAHADQTRADASGQPHALQFATAERVGRAVQREVIDADPFEKIEPPDDLAHDRRGNRLLFAVEGLRRRKTRVASPTLSAASS